MLPEKEAKAITLQIVQGLAYLNEAPRHIIHYDLKPANILFDSFGQAKITVRVPLPALMASSGLLQASSASFAAKSDVHRSGNAKHSGPGQGGFHRASVKAPACPVLYRPLQASPGSGLHGK